MADIILYTSEDGKTRLDLCLDGATIWLGQREIAELFQTTKQNVSLHARNIFQEGELPPDSVVKDSLTTAADGANDYRVRSSVGVAYKGGLSAQSTGLHCLTQILTRSVIRRIRGISHTVDYAALQLSGNLWKIA